MAEKKLGYAGRIKNSGVQRVEAPAGAEAKRGKTVTRKGSDLRGGK